MSPDWATRVATSVSSRLAIAVESVAGRAGLSAVEVERLAADQEGVGIGERERGAGEVRRGRREGAGRDRREGLGGARGQRRSADQNGGGGHERMAGVGLEQGRGVNSAADLAGESGDRGADRLARRGGLVLVVAQALRHGLSDLACEHREPGGIDEARDRILGIGGEHRRFVRALLLLLDLDRELVEQSLQRGEIGGAGDGELAEGVGQRPRHGEGKPRRGRQNDALRRVRGRRPRRWSDGD